MKTMETKEQVEKALFDIENFSMPRYLYKLESNSMKIYNTFYEIEYMYNVIRKVAEKNNLIINENVKKLYETSISRETADSNKNLNKIYSMREEYSNLQFKNYVKLYILLKDLLKHLENDFTLILNFYNNTYFSRKEDITIHARLGGVKDR